MEPDISDNVVVWTCDRLKYYKMLVDVYYKKLLCKGNTQWYLKVIPDKTDPIDALDGIHDRKFTFKLLAYGNLIDCDVIAVVISGKEVKEAVILKFLPNELEKTIFEIQYNGFKNFDLAIILRFPDVVDSVLTIPQIIEDQVEDIKSNTPEIQISQTDNLLKDFHAMFNEEYLSDLTIKCASKAFHVHKFVMCARSEVFKTMLSSPMQESLLDTVAIDDMDVEVLQSMIQFMYCGQVKIRSMDIVSGLFYGAEKYQIQSLKAGVLQYLEIILCEANAIEILEMADLYDERFKTKMIEFTFKNFNKLKLTKRWKELKSAKPALALEVYSYND